MTKPQLFHCLRYSDADRALEFLKAIGFEEVIVVRGEQDPSFVAHAQLRWRENGGVMLGSARDDSLAIRPGTGAASLVVESDQLVDETLERAIAAGATLVTPASNPPHGGRTGAVTDFEGNYWNIDSYAGE